MPLVKDQVVYMVRIDQRRSQHVTESATPSQRLFTTVPMLMNGFVGEGSGLGTCRTLIDQPCLTSDKVEPIMRSVLLFFDIRGVWILT